MLRNLSSFSQGNIVGYYRILLDTKNDGRISVLTQTFLPNLLITTMLCLSERGNSSKPLCKPVLIETSVVRSSHMYGGKTYRPKQWVFMHHNNFVYIIHKNTHLILVYSQPLSANVDARCCPYALNRDTILIWIVFFQLLKY